MASTPDARSTGTRPQRSNASGPNQRPTVMAVMNNAKLSAPIAVDAP